ncbi:hypothetical protein BDQ17DRAFT_1543603 [Cyathus striatus]|nr:hypothetical protein BDQ17DRAFT_1543603 [Cyathus striatus]
MYAFRSMKVEFSDLDGMRWTPAALRTRVNIARDQPPPLPQHKNPLLKPTRPRSGRTRESYYDHNNRARAPHRVHMPLIKGKRNSSHPRVLKDWVESSSGDATSSASGSGESDRERGAPFSGTAGGRENVRAATTSASGRENGSSGRVWERMRSAWSLDPEAGGSPLALEHSRAFLMPSGSVIPSLFPVSLPSSLPGSKPGALSAALSLVPSPLPAPAQSKTTRTPKRSYSSIDLFRGHHSHSNPAVLMEGRRSVSAPSPSTGSAGSLGTFSGVGMGSPLPIHILITVPDPEQGGLGFGRGVGIGTIIPPSLSNPSRSRSRSRSARERLRIPPSPSGMSGPRASSPRSRVQILQIHTARPKLRLPELYDGVGSAVFPPGLFPHRDAPRSFSLGNEYDDDKEEVDEEVCIYDLADEDDSEDYENEFEADFDDDDEDEDDDDDEGNTTFTYRSSSSTCSSGRRRADSSSTIRLPTFLPTSSSPSSPSTLFPFPFSEDEDGDGTEFEEDITQLVPPPPGLTPDTEDDLDLDEEGEGEEDVTLAARDLEKVVRRLGAPEVEMFDVFDDDA